MRAFIAIDLPDLVRGHLSELLEELSPGRPHVKWCKPEQIHLTLKFLGELPEVDLPRLLQEVGPVLHPLMAFPLAIRRLGTFGSGNRIRVIWAGVEDATGQLLKLQETLEQALAPLGFAPEERPFNPHLTLGRIREPRPEPGLVADLRGRTNFDGGSFSARSAVLFSSHLNPGGPNYSVIHRWPLGCSP